ncbi:hypothetical protein B353_12764 [Bacillus anthracis str. UR-1]|nr:hypothetical protein B353_12764 [Bacillus anthracis str. UR-1]
MKNFSRTGKILFSYGAIQMFWGLVMLNVSYLSIQVKR